MKSIAQVKTVFVEDVALTIAKTGLDRSQLCACSHKTRCFQLNYPVIMFHGYGRKIGILKLIQLSLHHVPGTHDNNRKQTGVPVSYRDIQCLGIHEIADEHGNLVSPFAGNSNISPAKQGLIDNIIMNKRRGMDNLSSSGNGYDAAGHLAAHAASKKHKGGTYFLTALYEQMQRTPVYDGYACLQNDSDFSIYIVQVSRNRV